MTIFEKMLAERRDIILDSEPLGFTAFVANPPALDGEVVLATRKAEPRRLDQVWRDDPEVIRRMFAIAADIGGRMMERLTPTPELPIYHVEGRGVPGHLHVTIAPSYKRRDFGAAYDPDRDQTPRDAAYVARVQAALEYSPNEIIALEGEILEPEDP